MCAWLAFASAQVLSSVWASAKNDPGLQDRTHSFQQSVALHGDEHLTNVVVWPNTPGATFDAWADGVADPMPYAYTGADARYDPPASLQNYEAAWALDERTRKMALLVLDMEEDYRSQVSSAIPSSKRVLDAFRARGLPIFWTNWAKTAAMGGGGTDRFSGFRGISNGENPNFVHKSAATMEELAPVTEIEKAREIKSLHFSKFADRHADGREILMPMLDELGIDTIVIVGSWTDICVLTTAYEAADRYGLDVIVVPDATATGILGHNAALFLMAHVVAKLVPSAELAAFIGSAPASILPVPVPVARLEDSSQLQLALVLPGGGRAVAVALLSAAAGLALVAWATRRRREAAML